MKTFLTGGTGFIGRYLVADLLQRGWDITALVRRPDSAEAQLIEAQGVKLVRGDVTDRESMRAGMAGADVVIHNAAWYELGVVGNGRTLMHAINVTGTENVLSLALELVVPRIMYVSSTMYFGATGPDPQNESYQRQKPYRTYYEQTKAEAHEIALRYQQQGLPLIIVCPNGVVGPNDHAVYGYFLRLYLNHLLAPFSWAPDVVNSLVHVKDVSRGITLAAEKGCVGETYILAGEPTSRRQLVQIWMKWPGGAKIRFYIPFWLVKLLFAPLEPLQRLAGLPAVISRETVSASVSMNYSSQKAQHELGWTYTPAQEMWQQIIDEELKLKAARRKRNLVSRLKPVFVAEMVH